MNSIYKKFYKQIKSIKDKKIIFWGASIFLESFLQEYSLDGFEVLGIVDINAQKWGQKVGIYTIFNPKDIKKLNPDCIIISIQNMRKDICNDFVKKIKKDYPKIKILPNILLKKSMEDFLSIKFLIKILDRIIPKKENKVIFLSYPDFTDNSKEYYDYLLKEHGEEFELSWLYGNQFVSNNNIVDKKFFSGSIRGIWEVIRSKYIVFSHSNIIMDLFYMPKHIPLALWHGMPLKTLGYIEKDITDLLFKIYSEAGKHSYFFVSSDIFKLSMLPCFLMNPNKIYITGQPRTDCIFTLRNNDKISKYIDYDKFDKVVIYAPTYKEALRCNKRDIDRKFDNIFYCDDYSESKFFNFIEEKNILFLIKPHPFDEVFYKKFVEKNNFRHPNMKIVYDEDMKNNGFYFYDFFKFADLMITDFSSIGIDYLITKKPIIFLNATSKEYSKNRGFILEDNYEILMPGAKADNFEKLIQEIENSLTVDSWKEKRLEMLPLLYKHLDGKSSERIYEIMKSL